MEQHLNESIRAIKIVYAGLVIGVILFLLISIYIVNFMGALPSFDNNFSNTLLIISNIFGLIAISFGFFIFNRIMAQIENNNVDQKIAKFRSAMITRAACQEGSAFLFMVCYLLTRNSYMIIESGIILLIMISLFPTNQRISNAIHEELN